MRTRRFLGSLIATAVVATPLAVVATAAPAAAATPTKVVLKLSSVKARFGDNISVTGEVKGQTTDGGWQRVPSGTAPRACSSAPSPAPAGRPWAPTTRPGASTSTRRRL